MWFCENKNPLNFSTGEFVPYSLPEHFKVKIPLIFPGTFQCKFSLIKSRNSHNQRGQIARLTSATNQRNNQRNNQRANLVVVSFYDDTKKPADISAGLSAGAGVSRFILPGLLQLLLLLYSLFQELVTLAFPFPDCRRRRRCWL